MTRNIFAACGALAIAGLTVSASQTPPPAQPGTPSTQPMGSGQSVTVTGCLKPWTGSSSTMGTTGAAGATGTTGTASTGAAAGASGQFVLTNVEKSGSMGSATSGTAPAASPSAMGAQNQYLLRAEGTTVNLSAHLNHKVELTGRAAADSRGTSGAATTGTTGTGTAGTGTTGTATSGTGMSGAAGGTTPPTLTVTALKMVSATCP